MNLLTVEMSPFVASLSKGRTCAEWQALNYPQSEANDTFSDSVRFLLLLPVRTPAPRRR